MRLAWDFFLPKMFLIIFDYIGTLIHAYIRTPDYSLSNLDQPINIKFCSWLSMTCIWQKIVLNGMPMIIFDSIHVHHWLPNFNLLSQSLDSRRELLHTWIGCEEVSLPFPFWVTQASFINERYVVCGWNGCWSRRWGGSHCPRRAGLAGLGYRSLLPQHVHGEWPKKKVGCMKWTSNKAVEWISECTGLAHETREIANLENRLSNTVDIA